MTGKKRRKLCGEEDEEEFRTPEDAGEDGDMSDTDENDTEAGNPEEESEKMRGEYREIM